MTYETENIEFKSQFTEEIYKEAIAFANTTGGVIYVGIDNDGNPIGLSDVEQEYTRITNGIRDAILPDITMFANYTIQEDRVVRITITEGTNKPYYLKSKGLKSNGVYIRQGTSSVPASPEHIRRMIKESDGDIYEEMRSINQNLTFNHAAGAFKKYGIVFNTEKYRILGMTLPSGNLFSNLALLLSDQCAHTIKIAVFGDRENTSFKDSKEFSGSIFKQLDDAFDYLRLCNRVSASFHGLERVELPDYPEEAIREALLNAIVHRDYGYSGSVIININDTELEFISIGGLVAGLSTEDIRVGISQPRNKKLAEVFHRLHLIESYGTGIRKIFSYYTNSSIQPRIEVTQNTFKIVLPNMNSTATVFPESSSAEKPITTQMQKIMDFILEHGHITEPEIQELLNLKRTRAYTLSKQMCERGLIMAVGRGVEKIYVLTKTV